MRRSRVIKKTILGLRKISQGFEFSRPGILVVRGTIQLNIQYPVHFKPVKGPNINIFSIFFSTSTMPSPRIYLDEQIR